VRQDTVQYDSAFSFFILSEYGWIGGISLLLLYCVPLVLVIISGKEVFDVGHGIATVVCGAFVLSAIVHAAMNWGNLPFTGRNLPLLSVNSFSDLLLWLLLLGLAMQAMLWRVSGDDGRLKDSLSLLSNSPITRWKRVGLLLPPMVLLLWSAVIGIRIIHDKELDYGFDWHGLLADVNAKIAQGDLHFNKTTLDIEPSMSLNTLLGQEIARFNALSREEKLEGTTTRNPSDFRAQLKRVRNLKDYDDLLVRLHSEDQDPIAHKRPVLFELSAPEKWADVDETIPAVDADYRLSANRAYNSRVNFHTGTDQDEFPQVALREGAKGTYSVQGSNYEFLLADHPAERIQDRAVVLAQAGTGLSVLESGDMNVPKARVSLRFHKTHKAAFTQTTFGEFEVRQDGLYYRPDNIKTVLRNPASKVPHALQGGIWHLVQPRDVIESAEYLAKDFRPRMAIDRSARGALVGPAWANGEWVLAYDPDPFIPWTSEFAQALWIEWRHADGAVHIQLAARYGGLTLSSSLQRSAQAFVARKGREWHAELLAQHGWRQALPPRVALTVADLPSGEVLALGGWPRMNSGHRWITSLTGGAIPDVAWLEQHAPKSIRQRYVGDRNFDRLLMGSSTKPLWAAAVLSMHPQLSRNFMVRGPKGAEDEVFGIHITPEWQILHESSSLRGGQWCDFEAYLARSDNRYHIRLGFLGLVDPGASSQFPTGANSASDRESMDGGRSMWRRVPEFPAEISFNETNPSLLRNLQARPLATHMHNMFGVGVERGDIREHRFSFWTGNEADDWLNPANENRSINPFFAGISPESPQLAMDSIRNPRGYITLLLGGGENLWANVDFAGAFATAVQGRPILTHITRNTRTVSEREEFPEISAQLRSGLTDVFEDNLGTAHSQFLRTGALAMVHSLPDVRIYGKTGTLSEESGLPSTSRLVLTLVQSNGNGTIRKGLSFSLVVERGKVGLASEWLGEYLVSESQFLRAYFGSR
jgi:hypothetical protein